MANQGLNYWVNIWKKQMLLNMQSRGNKDCTQYWENKEDALKYDQLVKEEGWKKPLKRIAKMALQPEDRILDIGAGTGALAIPLVKMVKEVTAIEPSENMLWCLQKNIADEKVTKIRCLKKRWETVCVEKDLKAPYDVVIASYSMGMTDIIESLRKMNSVASRAVYLFWFAENTKCENGSFLNLVSKSKMYNPKPQSDVLFNVLYNLGFNPNVSIESIVSQSCFQSIEDAVAKKMSEFNLTDEYIKNDVRNCLKKTLIVKDGHLLLNEVYNEATIWWKPKHE